MSLISVALPFSNQPHFERTLRQFAEAQLVRKIFVLHAGQYQVAHPKCEGVMAASLTSGRTLNDLLSRISTEYLLFIPEVQEIQLGQAALERFAAVAAQTSAAMTYADYFEIKPGVRSEHPVNDYQPGSIRDNFEFGPLLLFSMAAVRKVLGEFGPLAEGPGLYDLRLKLSVHGRVFHIQEYLSTKVESDLRAELAQQNIFVTSLNFLYNWGRRSSVWPMQFGLACCAFEMIAAACARYDIARFGAELFRASPRQADLMIVSGTVTKKMAPNVVRLYNQMAEPKYVIAMGACAISGGPFVDGYNVLRGIDRFIPVDVHIPGCPPRPEQILDAVMKIQKKIDSRNKLD